MDIEDTYPAVPFRILQSYLVIDLSDLLESRELKSQYSRSMLLVRTKLFGCTVKLEDFHESAFMGCFRQLDSSLYGHKE